MAEISTKTREKKKEPMLARVCNIGIRTAHIAVAGILVGGHVFSVPPARLYPWLYMTILTGAFLVIAEAHPHWRWPFEVCGWLVIAKVALMALIHWEWEHRIVLLFAVIVFGSIGAHMPRDIRHFRILRRPRPADPPER